MNESIEARALKLLENNRRQAVWNGKTYYYTVPSVKSYPFQWFWDSCFHAIVYAKLGKVEWAKEEIRSLLTAQREDGFIPHVIFWDPRKFHRLWWHYLESKGISSILPFFPKPRTSEEMQPPVLAQALAYIYKAGDNGFLRETIGAVNRYYTWLLQTRDPDGDSLISIISPFESGLDFSPIYDKAFGLEGKPGLVSLYRKEHGLNLINKIFYHWDHASILAHGPFHVEDVGVNAILALNLQILAKLNRDVGDDAAAIHYDEYATRVREALLAKCYDPARAAFFNLTGRNEQRFPVLTAHSLIPVILPDLPEEIVTTLMERHIHNEKEFWLPYPIPSVAASELAFSVSGPAGGRSSNWRGSTWINLNWFFVHALRRHGYEESARHLTRRTEELISRSGFREYFDPYTGEGCGTSGLGWSTLVVDM